jgi:hypothetical protein
MGEAAVRVPGNVEVEPAVVCVCERCRRRQPLAFVNGDFFVGCLFCGWPYGRYDA